MGLLPVARRRRGRDAVGRGVDRDLRRGAGRRGRDLPGAGPGREGDADAAGRGGAFDLPVHPRRQRRAEAVAAPGRQRGRARRRRPPAFRPPGADGAGGRAGPAHRRARRLPAVRLGADRRGGSEVAGRGALPGQSRPVGVGHPAANVHAQLRRADDVGLQRHDAEDRPRRGGHLPDDLPPDRHERPAGRRRRGPRLGRVRQLPGDQRHRIADGPGPWPGQHADGRGHLEHLRRHARVVDARRRLPGGPDRTGELLHLRAEHDRRPGPLGRLGARAALGAPARQQRRRRADRRRRDGQQRDLADRHGGNRRVRGAAAAHRLPAPARPRGRPDLRDAGHRRPQQRLGQRHLRQLLDHQQRHPPARRRRPGPRRQPQLQHRGPWQPPPVRQRVDGHGQRRRPDPGLGLHRPGPGRLRLRRRDLPLRPRLRVRHRHAAQVRHPAGHRRRPGGDHQRRHVEADVPQDRDRLDVQRPLRRLPHPDDQGQRPARQPHRPVLPQRQLRLTGPHRRQPRPHADLQLRRQ